MHDLQAVFQKLHTHNGDERHPTGLEPYLILERRKSSKPRARRVRDWDWPMILMMLFIGGTLVAAWL